MQKILGEIQGEAEPEVNVELEAEPSDPPTSMRRCLFNTFLQDNKVDVVKSNAWSVAEDLGKSVTDKFSFVSLLQRDPFSKIII